MSGGLEWIAEQREAEERYREHVKSGKFNKHYLESDISTNLNKEEIRLLAVRLIIHYLGGWTEFLSEEFGGFNQYFKTLKESTRKRFVKGRCFEYGFELAPTRKMDKLRKKIKEMESIMYPRSEE